MWKGTKSPSPKYYPGQTEFKSRICEVLKAAGYKAAMMHTKPSGAMVCTRDGFHVEILDARIIIISHKHLFNINRVENYSNIDHPTLNDYYKVLVKNKFDVEYSATRNYLKVFNHLLPQR